jgi:hypothetical protein
VLPFTKPWVFTKESNIESFFCSELCLEYLEFVKGVSLAEYKESVDPKKFFNILKKSGLAK